MSHPTQRPRIQGSRRNPAHEVDLMPGRLAADIERGFAVDRARLERVRGQVAAEYRRSVRQRAAVTPPGGMDRRPWSGPRLLVSFGLAAALLLASFGFVAANSGPGDAFYNLRLAAEELNLPFLGGSGNRLDRLEERLDEARAEAGDPAAVSAALRAYQDELHRALRDARSDSERQAVLAALAVHAIVLDELANDVPAAAEPGLEQARDEIGKAQESLHGGGSGPDRSPKPTETRKPANR